MDNREGKVTYMCKAIKDWEEENIAIGEKRGIKKGEKQGIKKGEKRGVKKGEKQGVKKGKDELLLSIVSKKITKGKTIPEIAEALEMGEDVIARIYRIAEKQIQEKSA